MARRKRKHKSKIVKLKHKPLYPMIYCLNEDKPIAVSQTRCKRGDKITWEHWILSKCEFLFGYEIDMLKYKKGDLVKCPFCGGNVDFRFWPSDTIPHLK